MMNWIAVIVCTIALITQIRIGNVIWCVVLSTLILWNLYFAIQWTIRTIRTIRIFKKVEKDDRFDDVCK